MQIAVVGAGIYGVTAALELRLRGHEVSLIDPGPLPHPLAASTDITKMIRMDYGDDALYTEMMEESFPVWREWNRRWGLDLFHEVGYLVLAPAGMARGGYEYESRELLMARGHALEMGTAGDVAARYPRWRLPAGAELYRNPIGGWAESGAVVGRLVDDCLSAGVRSIEAGAKAIGDDGVTLTGGGFVGADTVVVAAGAWTPRLLPELADSMWPVGQPVFHFRPDDPDAFRPPAFPPWAFDIGNTGWYGFPALADGIVKVANHGPGRPIEPDAPREIEPHWEGVFRDFFRRHLPALADAPLAGQRLCLYCDTFDGNFWIDRHPERERLVVATGGSGHGFKFAPVLGPIVADVVEGRENRFASRFAWRAVGARATEAARHA